MVLKSHSLLRLPSISRTQPLNLLLKLIAYSHIPVASPRSISSDSHSKRFFSTKRVISDTSNNMAGFTTQKYLNTQPGAQESEFERRKMVRDGEDTGVIKLGPINRQLEELYVRIPVNDGSGWHSTCKVFRPKSATQGTERPLIIMFHTGGFVFGSPEVFTRPGRDFALAFDAVVVSVEYRLAPEYPWPRPVFDAWDICNHLTQAAITGNAEIFGDGVDMDTAGFVIAGGSAGANLASAVLNMHLLNSSHREVDASLKTSPLQIPVSGIYMGVPFLLVDEIVPQEHKVDFTSRSLDPEDVKILNQCMQRYQADVHSPIFSPVNVSNEILACWPRTYMQVGEKDIWRDDATITASVLEKNGVQVKMDKYVELAHITWSVHSTGPEFDVNSELGRNTLAGMKWLLGNARTA